MKIPILNTDTIEQLRGFFHPKDRSVVLADNTFIEGEEVATPANPRHNRGRLYWKNSCWTQLDENGNESSLCHSGWQSWSPTVTQSGAVAATVTYARYVVIGNTVVIQAGLAITAAGTAGNVISIGGLPSAIALRNTGMIVDTIGTGTWRALTAGPIVYQGALFWSSVSNLQIIAHNAINSFGVVPNVALANGDEISFTGTYERA